MSIRHPADFIPHHNAEERSGDAVSTDEKSQRRGLFSKADKRAQKYKKPKKPRKKGPLTRLMNQWWDRLLGAATSRSFSEQEEAYAAHRTSRDYIWNTAGWTSWGFIFPILTVIVTQLVGLELAGMFSLAYVNAHLLYFLGVYGVRTYQVSDLKGEHSFKDYQLNRIITVIAMLVVGYFYVRIRGYEEQLYTMTLALVAFKAVDALGELYEGRLQQVDKLYLGGISLMIRSLVAFVFFTVALFITRDLTVSGIAMTIGALLTLFLFTIPLALFETPKSAPLKLKSVKNLFIQAFPLFIALFLYTLINNMPKFMMDGMLSYDNQLYFNALFFPAQGILLATGFIYKPLLVRMANAWADVSRRKQFDLFIVAMIVIIIAITVAFIGLMVWIGIPILSVLYGVDFSSMTLLACVMLAAGGVNACIDFLYQVITILRRQKVVTQLYLITFVMSIIILAVMIQTTQLEGAVVGYFVMVSFLFVLLCREYITVRIAFKNHPEKEEQAKKESSNQQVDGFVSIPEDKSENASEGQTQTDESLSYISKEEYEAEHPRPTIAKSARHVRVPSRQIQPRKSVSVTKDLPSGDDRALRARHSKSLDQGRPSAKHASRYAGQTKSTQLDNPDFYTGQTGYRSTEESSKEAARRRLAARREASASEKASANKMPRHAKSSTDK